MAAELMSPEQQQNYWSIFSVVFESRVWNDWIFRIWLSMFRKCVLCMQGADSIWICHLAHCGGKTILRQSYLHGKIPYTGKTTSLYWIGAQVTTPLFGATKQSRCCNDPTPGLIYHVHWVLSFPLTNPNRQCNVRNKQVTIALCIHIINCGDVSCIYLCALSSL